MLTTMLICAAAWAMLSIVFALVLGRVLRALSED